MTHEKVGILRRFAAKPGARLSGLVRVGPGGSERVLYMLAVTDDQGKYARLVVTEDFAVYLESVNRALEILARARAREPEENQPATISAAESSEETGQLPDAPRLAIPRFADRFDELNFYIANGWGNVPSCQIEEIIANDGSLPLEPPAGYTLRDQNTCAIVSNKQAARRPAKSAKQGANREDQGFRRDDRQAIDQGARAVG